jgi:hypothetical protein
MQKKYSNNTKLQKLKNVVNQVNSEQKKCLKGALTCQECILTTDSAKSELKQLKKVKKKCIFSKSK